MKTRRPPDIDRAAATMHTALRAGCAAVCLAAAAIGPAQAAEPIPRGARIAATCTGCHGTNGHTQGSVLPSLAGQQKDVLLAALKDFKSAKRPATIMTQIAKGYTDEQLEALASYFAAQRQGERK